MRGNDVDDLHTMMHTLKKVVLLYNMDLYLRTKKAGFLV